jgi:FkbM family methyltransferase
MHLGIAAGMKRSGGVGCRNALAALGLLRERTNAEVAFLRTRDLAARVAFDIGAFHGMHTLFFASRVGALGQVVAFEPHPENYDRVVRNVALNALSNVTVLPVAVGAGPGELTFAWASDPIATSANPDIRAAMGQHARTFRAPVTSVDAEIEARHLRAPDFVKIDVEGLELAVLQGMHRTLADAAPQLFIELHGLGLESKKTNSAAVAELLLDAGYSLLHVETGAPVIDPAASPPEGHLFAAVAASSAAAVPRVAPRGK